MLQLNAPLQVHTLAAQRAEELFQKHRQEIFKNTDRLFAGLMLFQWLAGIVAAVLIAPKTWEGQHSQIHLHVWAALFLGGAISIFPIYLALAHSGQAFTRYTIAAAQMLMSSLLIHISGGRIETHFHVFGSLVILSFYRDWRVLVPATIVVALDHFIRGIYFPQSVYGVLTASPWRSVEHAAWVVFEDVFLVNSCVRSVREMRSIAGHTAQLETTNQIIEEKVLQRTVEVKASEERFRLLMDGVRDYAIIMLDCQGRVGSWNEGARRIHGYNSDEIIGQPVCCFYIEEDIRAKRPEQELATAEAQERFEEEGWRVRKDGSQFWASAVITALRDEAGQLRGFSKVTRDITERKRVEDALQKAHSEMEMRVVQRTAELARTNDELHLQKTILESQGEASIDGILVVSEAGKILSFNRRFVEMWDIPPEVIAAQSDEAALRSVLSKMQDPEGFLSKVAYLYEHRDEQSQEEVLLKDGRIFDRYSAPVKGADGVNFGRIWFFHDITERKQNETAIHQAKEEAERANRAKSEFLSRMSHELRTPLNAIIGFAQIMRKRSLDPKDQEGVEHIYKAGRHLLDLINEVLDISRIEAGRMSLSPEPTPISRLARESLDLVAPLAAARQIQIVKPLERGQGHQEWHVLADQQRLKQVLINLLSNAIKYNRIEGRVTLDYEVASNSKLRITVSDTGLGLSPAEIEKMFVPFERLKAAHSQIEGTGMGLALSKRLVEAMGGSIGVKSVVGEGSCFWIELPLVEAPLDRHKRLVVDEPLADTLLPDVPDAGRTVLYIEDNLSNLRLMEYMLEDRPDIKLLSAMQGSVGLELAHRHQPDLILLDLHLPDILGDEVLRRLQGNPHTDQIPVVMVSADATRHEIDRLLTAGAKDYLTKPLDVSHCMQILQDTFQDGDR